MPCLYCRKMSCLNGSRKLHFVQKIRLDRIILYLGPEGFFAHLRNFLQVLDLHIFRQIFEMQPCLHSKKGPHSWGRP